MKFYNPVRENSFSHILIKACDVLNKIHVGANYSGPTRILGSCGKQNTSYGKCSKISNTLKLRTPKIIAENNFQKIEH